MIQVSVKDIFHTSMGMIIFVANDRVFSIGEQVLTDTGECFRVTGISFPTTPNHIDDVGLVVEMER